MKTSELYQKEIAFLRNKTLQQIISEVMNMAPKCIQTIPASSTGKYHPNISLGEGGLVRHTKSAVGIARSLTKSNLFKDLVFSTNLGIETTKTENELLPILEDVVIAALIIHDSMKPDNTPKHYTVFEHPLLAAKLFKEIATKYISNENIEYMKIVIPLIYHCVASHMGKWNKNPRNFNSLVLPEPKNGCEQIVHLCDFIVSRRYFGYDFDKGED